MAEDVTINHDDVHAFADKLDQWGDTLPDSQKGMLQLLLGRAEAGGAAGGAGAEAAAPHDMSTAASPGETAASVLRPLLQHGATANFAMTPNARCTWSTWSRGIQP